MKKLIVVIIFGAIEYIIKGILVFMIFSIYSDVKQIKIQTNEIICEALEMENGRD